MSETNPDPKALEGAVDQVRRLIASLRKTKAPREDLLRVEREVAALAALLAPNDHPGPYAQAALEVGTVVENGGQGLDTVRVALNTYVLSANVENLIFFGVGDVFRPDGGKERAFNTLWWQAGRYLQLCIGK